MKRKIVRDILAEYNAIPVRDAKNQKSPIPSQSPRATNSLMTVFLGYRKYVVIGAAVVAAAAAAVLLLFTPTLSFLESNTITDDHSEDNTPNSVAEADVYDTEIPAWYAPQKLRVSTVTFNIDNLINDLKRTSTEGGNPDAVHAVFSKLGNPAFGGIKPVNSTNNQNIIIDSPKLRVAYYVNPNTKQVVEPLSLIKKNMGLDDSVGIYVMDYGPTHDYGPKNWDYIYYITYTGYDKNYRETDVAAYCMEVGTGMYRQLPSVINWSLAFISVTSDGKYISVQEIQNSLCDKVYVINTDDMSVKLLTDKMVECAPQISPNDHILFYNTADNSAEFDLSLDKRRKTGNFYYFATGEIVQSPVEADNRGNALIGELADKYGAAFNANQFFDNDRYYIGISAKDHVTPIVVDTKSGQVVDDTMLESLLENNIGRYSVGRDWTAYASGNVLRYDFLNTEPVLVKKGFNYFGYLENCYTVSQDGKYAYTYTPGDATIQCFDVMTMQSFEIDIGDAFPDQIAQLESQGIYAVEYRIAVSGDKTQVVLNFSLDNRPDDGSHERYDPHRYDPPGFSPLSYNLSGSSPWQVFSPGLSIDV